MACIDGNSTTPSLSLGQVHRAAARLIGWFTKTDDIIPAYAGGICTSFHCYNASHTGITGLRPWCGSACLVGSPHYLRKLCCPLSSAVLSIHVDLVVALTCSATMQCHFFSVIASTTLNQIFLDLRHLPNGACSQSN